MLKNRTIEDYLNQTVISLGKIATSLGSKICNITIEKIKNNRINNFLIDTNELETQLISLNNEDIEACNKLSKAYKSKDDEEIQKALKYATEIPMKTIELNYEILELLGKIKSICYEETIPMIYAAQQCASAAIRINILNVRISLREISDKKFVEKYKKRCNLYGLKV